MNSLFREILLQSGRGILIPIDRRSPKSVIKISATIILPRSGPVTKVYVTRFKHLDFKDLTCHFSRLCRSSAWFGFILTLHIEMQIHVGHLIYGKCVSIINIAQLKLAIFSRFDKPQISGVA